MFRLVLIATCLAAGAYAYSDGAPNVACKDLIPQHGAEFQKAPVPYTLDGPSHVHNDQKIELTLGGDNFLGFMIQARNGNNEAVGEFRVLEEDVSQTLKCFGKSDTLTHKKINKATPLQSVKFEWTPPKHYKGNVKFMATVVQESFVYWVGKVRKDVIVEEP